MANRRLGRRKKSLLNQFKSRMKSWSDDGNAVLWKAIDAEENVSRSAKKFANTTGKGEKCDKQSK